MSKPRRMSAAGLPSVPSEDGTKFYRFFRSDRSEKRGIDAMVPAIANFFRCVVFLLCIAQSACAAMIEGEAVTCYRPTICLPRPSRSLSPPRLRRSLPKHRQRRERPGSTSRWRRLPGATAPMAGASLPAGFAGGASRGWIGRPSRSRRPRHGPLCRHLRRRARVRQLDPPRRPATFPLKRVIAGWQEGVQLMHVDEIWSFTYAKRKNVTGAKAAPANAGDTWTWTAIDADSNVLLSYLVGGRDAEYAMWFMDDLALRLASRVQLTSDGHRAYLVAVEGAFGCDVDYAQFVKLYGSEGGKGSEVPTAPPNAPASASAASKQPGRGARFDQLCRASEPDHADAHAPLHAPYQRLLKEDREPRPCGRASHDVL